MHLIKANKILVILLFVVQSVLAKSEELKLVFNDDFSDNSNNWSNNYDDQDKMLKIEDGFYYFEHYRTSGSWFTKKDIDINTEEDFKIETLIKKVSGIQNNGFGLNFGRKDNDNEYEFEISGDGHFRIDKNENGIHTKIKPWTKSSAINTGNNSYNKLSLIKKSSNLEYYINDQLVFTGNFQRFFGNNIGFTISEKQKIAIDYLKVYSLILTKETVFTENFSDNSNNWSNNYDDQDRMLKIEDGFYYFEHYHTSGSWFTKKDIDINTEEDFKIETLIKKVSGIQNNGFGLNFGRKDNDNEYEFEISGDGHFRIDKNENGIYTKIKSWTKSSAINTGNNSYNKLSLIKKSSNLKYYINDQLVFTGNFQQFFGNNIGFTISEKQKIAIDYLRIFYLEKEVYNYPPEILITEPNISRGIKIAKVKTIRIAGRANDSDGIYEVTINGLEANLRSGGHFIGDVPLAIGNNTITVIATDTKMESSTKTFEINRQSVDFTNNDSSDEKRVALVFGNSNYSSAANLGVNPINDANDIASTLKLLGFDVILKTDVNLSKMNDAIREFGQRNKDAEVALFYFAGHGMQVDRINYLLPIEVNIKDKNDVNFECVNVSTIQKIMETSNPDRLNLIILDACRNNPFRVWQRGGSTGLADMTPPSGTLIAFATSPGSTASNSSGRNGLYTGELVKQLKISQRIEDVFINTRIEVEKKSGGQQSPWELARLRGVYYLSK